MKPDGRWFEPAHLPRLLGNESFVGVDATVQDFWRFSMGDLRMNNARGHLAEFLVAKALDLDVTRVEWDEYDLRHGDIRIEVKASGRLQSWGQPRLSTVNFTGLQGRAWTRESGRASVGSFNADVYVFCTQIAEEPENYEPLDINQWVFHVVPAARIAEANQKSMRLSKVAALSGGATEFDDLAAAIAVAHQANSDTIR